MGLSSGYDDNLTGVTRYSSFDLTLPSGNVPVELDEDERQRGGRFARLDLGYDAEFAANVDARWRYSLMGSHTQSVDYTSANLSQAALRVERAPEGEYGWYGVGLLQYQRRGKKLSTTQGQLGSGIEWGSAPLGVACRTRLGVETLTTHYADNGLSDGRYLGLFSHWVCSDAQLQLQWRAGVDMPVRAERSGGEQRQYGLRVSRAFVLGQGVLTAEADFFRQKDQRGYSALLANNAPRALSRMIYRAEYRWNYGRLSPYVSLERMDQRSNLPLFAPHNWIFSVGLRRVW